jgi:pSer/pThr/pTyr-binding forkhead associated (FHA) protein
MNVYLLVLEGKHAGLVIKLPPTQFVIGRDESCHLRPVSTDVSRFHCAVARMGRRVMVRDLKSSNGTFVNDQPVGGTVRVQDGDVLRIGPLKLQFQVRAEEGLESGDSGLKWLVRKPDEQESRQLDPSADTAIISMASLPGARASLRSTRDQTQAAAVAGEFLRDYLKRRQEQRPTS